MGKMTITDGERRTREFDMTPERWEALFHEYEKETGHAINPTEILTAYTMGGPMLLERADGQPLMILVERKHQDQLEAYIESKKEEDNG